MVSHTSDGVLSNLFVINCWINGSINLSNNGNKYYTKSAYFYNNFISGSYFDVDGGAQEIYTNISNNVISTKNIRLNKGSFVNNIVRASDFESSRGSDLIENNVFISRSSSSTLLWPSGTGTTAIDVPATTNLLVPDIAKVVRWEGDWWQNLEIVENSPAIGYGNDGTDAGVFGGLHPWDKDQMPPLSFISSIQVPAIVSQGEGMTVRLKVKSNN